MTSIYCIYFRHHQMMSIDPNLVHECSCHGLDWSCESLAHSELTSFGVDQENFTLQYKRSQAYQAMQGHNNKNNMPWYWISQLTAKFNSQSPSTTCRQKQKHSVPSSNAGSKSTQPQIWCKDDKATRFTSLFYALSNLACASLFGMFFLFNEGEFLLTCNDLIICKSKWTVAIINLLFTLNVNYSWIIPMIFTKNAFVPSDWPPGAISMEFC